MSEVLNPHHKPKDTSGLRCSPGKLSTYASLRSEVVELHIPAGFAGFSRPTLAFVGRMLK
jgi:hypothetical protein